ncbi:hypothetical protein V8C26DRAFT_396472 [Trichoderma gracile]
MFSLVNNLKIPSVPVLVIRGNRTLYLCRVEAREVSSGTRTLVYKVARTSSPG